MSEGMAVRAEEPSGMAQATAHSNSTSTQTTALFISTSEYELRCELPSRSQLTLPYCMPGLQPEDQTKVQWNSAGQRGWHHRPTEVPSRTCHTSERGICFPFAITLSVLRLCAASQKQILGPS